MRCSATAIPAAHASSESRSASYLGRARAVAADPARIVIFGGFANALTVLADTFRHLGIVDVAVEDPALPFHPRFLRRAGLSTRAVPVDDLGVRVDVLAGTSARAVLTTPAHQYPLGVALAPARRTALVEWARRSDAWIIEDDYDGEFRYDRQPVGAVQSLDPERVIYGGTASKSLGAGLHIAWLVVPDVLLEPLVETARSARRGIGRRAMHARRLHHQRPTRPAHPTDAPSLPESTRCGGGGVAPVSTMDVTAGHLGGTARHRHACLHGQRARDPQACRGTVRRDAPALRPLR